jgi:transcriptional regulator with XRE-family HTH domain
LKLVALTRMMPPKEMLMGVGRRLRQAREARGLSMAEVAASTKIPVRQLASLEAEEYDALPGGIFVRGHIRAAAKAVGLDPADVTEHYQEEMRPSPLAASPATPGLVEDPGPRLRMAAEPPDASKPKGHLVAALVILLSIVLALAWFGRERDAPPSSRNDGGMGPSSPMLASASRASIGEPQAIGTIGTMPRGQDPEGVPLQFTALRVCWLALTVDGHRIAYRMLQEGETVTAHMQQRAAVRAGDAGALLLSVGHGAAKPLGAPGAVRKIEFTPADYVRLLGQ